MGSVLVTGAAGFIGSHVCEALLARGDRVVGLDNLDDYYDADLKRRNLTLFDDNSRFAFVQQDIREFEQVRAVFLAHDVDRVVHLAGLAGVRASVERARDYVAVNVMGAHNLMEAALQHSVSQFVLASTSSVYGEAERIPFSEHDRADRPLAPYPATKRAAELLAYTYHHLHQQSYAVVRFFSVYGPRGRPDMMPYMIAESIVNGREIKLFDGGRLQRDWTYVTDIAAGIIGALDTPLGFQTYNLGRGEPVWMSDFVEILEGLAGKKANIVVVPAPSTEPTRTFADVSHARAQFGYDPQVSIEEGLVKFWAWFAREVADAPER